MVKYISEFQFWYWIPYFQRQYGLRAFLCPYWVRQLVYDEDLGQYSDFFHGVLIEMKLGLISGKCYRLICLLLMVNWSKNDKYP